MAVNFRKAYDPIKRDGMVKLLCKYKVPPGIVDFVVRMYTEDIRGVFPYVPG